MLPLMERKEPTSIMPSTAAVPEELLEEVPPDEVLLEPLDRLSTAAPLDDPLSRGSAAPLPLELEQPTKGSRSAAKTSAFPPWI